MRNDINMSRTLRDGPSEGLLLHGREVILGSPSDGDSEVSEAEAISDHGGPHDRF